MILHQYEGMQFYFPFAQIRKRVQKNLRHSRILKNRNSIVGGKCQKMRRIFRGKCVSASGHKNILPRRTIHQKKLTRGEFVDFSGGEPGGEEAGAGFAEAGQLCGHFAVATVNYRRQNCVPTFSVQPNFIG